METLQKAYLLGLISVILVAAFFVIGFTIIIACEFKKAVKYWRDRFKKKLR